MAENDVIITRSGYTTLRYIEEFLQFLYLRTGFQFDVFNTPKHFQNLLDQIAFNKVPLSVWNGILTCTLSIANRTRDFGSFCHEFGSYFIDCLVWVFKKLVRIGLLEITIFLYRFNFPIVANAVIGLLYYVIDYFVDTLWTQFVKFIQSKLVSAAYHDRFVMMA